MLGRQPCMKRMNKCGRKAKARAILRGTTWSALDRINDFTVGFESQSVPSQKARSRPYDRPAMSINCAMLNISIQ
jgi:hypothetical protein